MKERMQFLSHDVISESTLTQLASRVSTILIPHSYNDSDGLIIQPHEVRDFPRPYPYLDLSHVCPLFSITEESGHSTISRCQHLWCQQGITNDGYHPHLGGFWPGCHTWSNLRGGLWIILWPNAHKRKGHQRPRWVLVWPTHYWRWKSHLWPLLHPIPHWTDSLGTRFCQSWSETYNWWHQQRSSISWRSRQSILLRWCPQDWERSSRHCQQGSRSWQV